MSPKRFSPLTIKGLSLKNRIILPAMGPRFTRDRFVNQTHIDYHAARASGLLRMRQRKLNPCVATCRLVEQLPLNRWGSGSRS